MGMLTATAAALALASGAPPWAVLAFLVVAWKPWLPLVAVPGWLAVEEVRRRRRAPGADDEAAFLRALAAELSAGASLRSALVAAAPRAPRLDLVAASRLAAAGMPAQRVAAAVRAALPVNGRLAAAAWLLAARSGGPAAGIAQALAARAAEEGVLRRERRALTAQARASAWVVAGLPAALLLAMAVTGRLAPASDPALAAVLMVGLGLQASGAGLVWWMMRRAER